MSPLLRTSLQQIHSLVPISKNDYILNLFLISFLQRYSGIVFACGKINVCLSVIFTLHPVGRTGPPGGPDVARVPYV